MLSKTYSLNIKHKIKPFSKSIKVDSDKSLSIRAFLIGSISRNISYANNILESEDVFSTIKACKKLGSKIIKIKNGKYKIYGNGLGSFFTKKNSLINFGNSGTLARLLIGILATTPGISLRVTGDHSLKKRNMRELIEIMKKFGAVFLPKKKYKFPLKIISSPMPVGINYKAGVSAQLKSAVIFAALNSNGNTKIIETKKSRDHTENLLIKNIQAVKIYNKKKKIIKVFGKKYLDPINIDVPGDVSSSAFFS